MTSDSEIVGALVVLLRRMDKPHHSLHHGSLALLENGDCNVPLRCEEGEGILIAYEEEVAAALALLRQEPHDAAR